MARALWWGAMLLGSFVCAACERGLGVREGGSCPAGYETCQGGSDCYSECVCNGGASARCVGSCDAEGGPYVSELDESAWGEEWQGFEMQVLELTNRARARGGCCGEEGCFGASLPLELDDRLRRAARAHAREMGEEGYFGHDSADGRTPFDRMREAGFRGCALGENIAAGQPTAGEVVDDWLQSPGHCANILHADFAWLGVGFYERSGVESQPLWVQDFGG